MRRETAEKEILGQPWHQGNIQEDFFARGRSSVHRCAHSHLIVFRQKFPATIFKRF